MIHKIYASSILRDNFKDICKSSDIAINKVTHSLKLSKCCMPYIMYEISEEDLNLLRIISINQYYFLPFHDENDFNYYIFLENQKSL